MASLSKVPKQMQYGRRLSELLQEQQEPFLLDVYLLENGYSSRALKSPSVGRCCSLSACSRLLRLCRYGFKRRGGVLRYALVNFVYQKVIKKRTMQVFSCFCEMGGKPNLPEFRRLSSSCDIDEGESDGDFPWKAMEDSRQLSPVSVLDMHSDQVKDEKPSTSGSSPKQTAQASWLDFEEIIGSTSPVPHNCKINQSGQLLSECVKEVEEMIWDSHECLSPQRTGKLIEEQIISWEKLRGDIAKLTHLIHLDFSRPSREWRQFQSERKEIGMEIETQIFEDIRREAVMDILSSHCTLKTCRS
ncbi:uncharacterized protein [Typha angustifolia]|uniref:uncharacterized protein n=1 Tax=Typha angustifolia TaxID=59011 RepID=UPI003C2BD478